MNKASLPLLLFTFPGLNAATLPGETRPPNVIIFLTDDQGWGDLRISGNNNLETPNIDKLSETGVTFTHFFVSPVCSPTRAELLTGRYHTRGGVYSTSAGGERLDLDETTVGDIFKRAGYVTAAYGKWHNGSQPPYHPNARGFDDFYGFCSGHWGNYFSPVLEHNGSIVNGNGFVIDDFTDHGLRFIEKNKDRPFFLYLPYNSPHSPMQVPDKWWEKFADRELEMWHQNKDLEDVSFTKAALAMCENMDWNVGRIMQKIEQLGLIQNTIIVYLSDNGPNSWRWNGGMKGRKGSTDEGGVRVPFFIKWEGILPAGIKIPEIAGAIDLLPTLTDLAGIKLNTDKQPDGKSLKPLMTKENKTWNERFLFNHWNGRTSVRSQNFRLDHTGQLYHMIQDPGQLKPVNDKFPEERDKMLQARVKWEAEVGSELPKEDNRPFPIGHPDYNFTFFPARDGTGIGSVKRSNQFPNDSFFTNWVSTGDSIVWPAEVLADGDFEVEVYYTCPWESTGSTIELSFNDIKLSARVLKAHNPPLKGMENDRVERIESYIKDFIPLKMGTVHLKKGMGKVVLRATHIPGSQAMDFRMIYFRRL